MQQLQEAFDLVPAPRALRGTVAHAPIRGTYRAPRHQELLVVDKENGGKADALNAGVDAARYPYVCAVDADAIIEPEALLRVAKPLLDDPDLVVATGGIVRIANGCTVEDGRVTEVRLPSSRLATLQVVEYFRAFLVGRVGWSQLHALLIISGAFGLFRRSTRRGRRRLGPHHGRRGHGARGADAPPHARAGQGLPRAVRARPGVLDRGARDAEGPVAAAPALAARARRDAVAAQEDDAEPEVRRARDARDAVLHRVRAARAAAGAARVRRAARLVGARAAVVAVRAGVLRVRRDARPAAVDQRAGARGVLVPPPPARPRDPAHVRVRRGREPGLPAAHGSLARRRVLGPPARQEVLGGHAAARLSDRAGRSGVRRAADGRAPTPTR